MTQRERQLLEWIRENPMISQQELADKAGITRSSAAVHISSLMKKGYIAGRGYLLRTDPYIVVVGGVNMDIGAVSHAPLVARDSNPGRVTTSLGGVGRNIAHNLCLLGEQVSMVTVLGQDSFAQSVRENAAAIGLDLTPEEKRHLNERSDLPRRSPLWSAAASARKTAFSSKRRPRLKRPAARRSLCSIRPAPSRPASRKSPIFSRRTAFPRTSFCSLPQRSRARANILSPVRC